jgi:hypothetical protein
VRTDDLRAEPVEELRLVSHDLLQDGAAARRAVAELQGGEQQRGGLIGHFSSLLLCAAERCARAHVSHSLSEQVNSDMYIATCAPHRAIATAYHDQFPPRRRSLRMPPCPNPARRP